MKQRKFRGTKSRNAVRKTWERDGNVKARDGRLLTDAKDMEAFLFHGCVVCSQNDGDNKDCLLYQYLFTLFEWHASLHHFPNTIFCIMAYFLFYCFLPLCTILYRTSTECQLRLFNFLSFVLSFCNTLLYYGIVFTQFVKIDL